MQNSVPEVQRNRFNLQDSCQYILQGTWPENGKPEAELDGHQLEVQLEMWHGSSILSALPGHLDNSIQNVTLTIQLPQTLENYHILKVYAVTETRRLRWFHIRVSELQKEKQKPQFFLEQIRRNAEKGNCTVNGWVVSDRPVTIAVEDRKGDDVPCRITRVNRVDVQAIFQECHVDEKCGFAIEIQNFSGSEFQLKFITDDQINSKVISLKRGRILWERMKEYRNKTIRYINTHGIIALPGKIIEKISGRGQTIRYKDWVKRHLPGDEELSAQRTTAFEWKPRFSIVVPLYKTPEKYLKKLIRSIQQQTYSEWELCLSDGSGMPSPLSKILQELTESDNRINAVYSEKPLRISANTNAAIEKATGDFIVFVDHDDELTPDALFECVKALNDHPEVEILYSDEDKIASNSDKLFEPQMKPDFNLDLLRTVNYICHLFVVKKELLDRTGLLRSEFDGAQDYDLILRCIEKSQNIWHIPKILYHWRSHQNSTSENPESKGYAFEAGKRALEAHYERLQILAVVYHGEFPGLYRTKYQWEERPLISILIPNKDHTNDLERCIKSIDERSEYRNYEYIIIENNSEKQETFRYYEELQKRNSKVKILYWKREFNYSAINNFGAKAAHGNYLLFLNNDTEIINTECLKELLGYCMRPDVGAVGARLYYEDDTIQHAGVIIGFGGIAGHCFVQQPRTATGYCHRIICAQDYSAVTAACMMVKRQAFDRVGGLSEDLAVAFNDIDFCLKLRKAGYLVVYNPYAELYHYESKSRGPENTPEKVARFNQEIQTFAERWNDILQQGDPYYSPNLTLDSQDFSLRAN